jgi:hypothetical protein
MIGVYWSMDDTPEETDLINRCDEAQTWEARLAAGTLPKQPRIETTLAIYRDTCMRTPGTCARKPGARFGESVSSGLVQNFDVGGWPA